jgi:hypothetical protein
MCYAHIDDVIPIHPYALDAILKPYALILLKTPTEVGLLCPLNETLTGRRCQNERSLFLMPYLGKGKNIFETKDRILKSKFINLCQ